MKIAWLALTVSLLTSCAKTAYNPTYILGDSIQQKLDKEKPSNLEELAQAVLAD